MSVGTRIEWTEATWNPVTGCKKVSEGCDNCYAETFAERWRGIPGHPFEQGFDLRLWPERLTLPLRWRRPRKVFVNSMSDLFIDDVDDEFVAKVFAVMVAAPQHTFQVLTKRPRRMRSLLSGEAFWLAVAAELGRLWNAAPPAPLRCTPPWIWLGVSAENQRWADIRIPALLETPAVVRFISAEPLLGPIRLDPQWLSLPHDLDDTLSLSRRGRLSARVRVEPEDFRPGKESTRDVWAG
jgi:protein gp37